MATKRGMRIGHPVLAAGELGKLAGQHQHHRAAASVTMAKKIAFTRSENRPIRSASTSAASRDAAPPEQDRVEARAHRLQRDRVP
jgi:hypothetical protein